MKACALLLFCWASGFEVLEFPLPTSDSTAFVARVEPTGSAEVFVLSGRTLRVYSDADPEALSEITLRPGTTALDVADTNADGRSELVTVAGDKIVRYSLPEPNPVEGAELYQLHTQYSVMRGPPHLQVLVMQHEGAQVLALPVGDALELRTASGNLVGRLPLEESPAGAAGYGHPFGVRVQAPPQLGPRHGLELRVSHQSIQMLHAQDNPWAADAETSLSRRGTSRHLLEAAKLSPEHWPWFPLRPGQPAQERVLYAAADDGFRELLVRIRREQVSPETGAVGFEAGPPRRYPGNLVTQRHEQPDFDGDGYADLLLWSPAEARVTVNALTRAAVSGKWPLLLLVHLYAPDKNRYEPRLAAHLRVEVPINWYLDAPAEAPLRNVVLADFNGDGRTDLGCSTMPDEYSIWLFSETGFPDTPTFTWKFPERLERLAFTADLGNRNRISIGIRGEQRLYLLRPGPDLPSFPPPVQRAVQGLGGSGL